LLSVAAFSNMGKKFKNRFASIIKLFLIMLIFVSVTFCSVGLDLQKVDAAESKITVWLNETDNMMQQFIEKKLREKYPDITVDLIMTRNADKTSYLNAVKSGRYDVFTSPEGNYDAIVASGAVAPIESYLTAQKFEKMVCGAAIQEYEDGHIYTIPYEPANYTVIYYNRVIFKKYGLEVPKTADEFLKVCEVLKSNGVAPLASSSSEAWQSCMLFDTLALTVDPEISKKYVNGKASLADAPYVWAAGFIRTLVDNEYIPQKFLTRNYTQNIESFTKGEVAMVVDGSWSLSIMSTKSVNKSGWFFIPVKDISYLANYGTASGSSMKIGNGFLVSKDCKEKDTAVKVGICIAAAYAEYRYFYGDTTPTIYKAEELGWEIQTKTPYFGVTEFMLETQKMEHMYPYLQDVSKVGSDICSLLQQLMNKKISVDEFASEAVKLDAKGRKSY
jgi:ABC-type glycerol-3-phosphate transport system substrate-binding protein